MALFRKTQPKDLTPLQLQHVEFKQHAAEVLWRFGDSKDFCSDFDVVLTNNGIPGRPRMVRDSRSVDDIEIIGEETEEEFEAWKIQTSQNLDYQARRHGITGYLDILEEIGFPVPQQRRVRIEGSFSLELEVRVPDGADLIESIDIGVLRDRLYYGLNRDGGRDGVEVTWKAIDADVDPVDAS